MRDLVTKKSFLLRKFLDKILFTFIPNSWIPLYFAVQFTRMSFRECIEHKEWQDKVRIRYKMHAVMKTIFFVTGIKNECFVSWIFDFCCFDCSFFAKRHVNSIAY